LIKIIRKSRLLIIVFCESDNWCGKLMEGRPSMAYKWALPSFLVFMLLPSVSMGQLSLEIIEPEEGAIIHETFTVSVSISSTYEVTSAYVDIDGSRTDLVYSAGKWSTSVTLIDPVSGPYSIVAKAIDAFDNTSTDSVNVVLDYPPVLVVEEPTQWSVARPNMRIKVQCQDDDPNGCASIEVIPAGLVVEGVSSIDQEISLPSFDGHRFPVTIIGTDSGGQTVEEKFFSFGEFSNRLTEVESVRGRVIDADSTRILYVDDTVYYLSNHPEEAFLYDRTTGLSESIMANIDFYWGALTDFGAIVYAAPEEGPNSIFDYRSGQISGFAGRCDYTYYGSYHGPVAGDYLLYRPQYSGNLVLRNLRMQSEEIITDDNDFLSSERLAPNGDVVYKKEWYIGEPERVGEVFRYREGVTEQITSTEIPGVENSGPITDGINVVYTKEAGQDSTWIYTSAGDSVRLEQDSLGCLFSGLSKTPCYAVNNGWIAFVRKGPTDVNQVWVRSPDGFEEQISFFSTWSIIDTLAPNGEVMFINRDESSPSQYVRYLGIPGGTIDPEPVERVNWHWSQESSLYQSDYSYYENGQWYVVIGRTIFAVNDEPTLDGGVEDGNGADGDNEPVEEDGGVEDATDTDGDNEPVEEDGGVPDGNIVEEDGGDDTSADNGDPCQNCDVDSGSGSCAGCHNAGRVSGTSLGIFLLLLMACARLRASSRKN
jgi:hypothetical protein